MTNVVTRFGSGMGPWFHTKIVDPLLQILQRGAEPKQLAFSAGLGITLGVFPICGVTVFLCALAIAVLGSFCHAPTVMLANFVATPIELRCFKEGADWSCIKGGLAEHLACVAGLASCSTLYLGGTLCNIFAMFYDPDTQVQLLGWLVAAPFILAALYVIFLPCFVILVRKFSAVPLSPKKPLLSHAEIRLKVRDV